MSEKIMTASDNALHAEGCPCCSLTLPSLQSRRQFLTTGAAVLAGGMMGFVPGRSMAASGNYEAMLINCIDPRFTTLSWQYMGLLQGVDREKLGDNYSHFVMAGGPLGAVHPKFAAWHKTFWDNLGASVQLHNIKKVIVVNHRDCGAAKIAYGEDKVSNSAIETVTHKQALLEFRRQLTEKFPAMGAQLGLMGLDGTLEIFS